MAQQPVQQPQVAGQPMQPPVKKKKWWVWLLAIGGALILGIIIGAVI